MKPNKILAILIMALCCFVSTSCSDESDEPGGANSILALSNLNVEIFPDGTTSNGAIFSKIDGTTFWLDYVEYQIVESHLEIIGCDKYELPLEPRLYAEATLDGVTYKTRAIRDFYTHRAEKVVIPNTIEKLHDESFAYCSSLKEIFIPKGVTSLGRKCFWHCISLEKIILPEGLKSIGADCFKECKALRSIDIPEGTISIYSGCFSECTSLNSVVFPKSIERHLSEHQSIHLFSECPSLEKLTFLSENPPKAFTYGLGLYASDKEKVSVYVPRQSVELYISKQGSFHYKEILPIE